MLRDLFPRDHRRYEESRYGDELESFAASVEFRVGTHQG